MMVPRTAPHPGTQCFAWLIRLPGRAGLPDAFTETQRFRGNRIEIRQAASAWALQRIPHYYALATSTGTPPDAAPILTDIEEQPMTSATESPGSQPSVDHHPQTPETVEVKVSGEGNGLVDDETSGARVLPTPGKPLDSRKTANQANGGEGDEDATSQ